jgi:hypothetical protein
MTRFYKRSPRLDVSDNSEKIAGWKPALPCRDYRVVVVGMSELGFAGRIA